MAGVGAGSGITRGVTPCAARISAAKETQISPRKRGSRPTITAAPCGFWGATYRAMPVTARRTLSSVKSSAMIPRQPEVPNLMATGMVGRWSSVNSRWPLPGGQSFTFKHRTTGTSHKRRNTETTTRETWPAKSLPRLANDKRPSADDQQLFARIYNRGDISATGIVIDDRPQNRPEHRWQPRRSTADRACAGRIARGSLREHRGADRIRLPLEGRRRDRRRVAAADQDYCGGVREGARHHPPPALLRASGMH